MGNLEPRGHTMDCPWCGKSFGVNLFGFLSELDEYEEAEEHCPHCDKSVVVSYFFSRNWECLKGE